ncbi:MAG TPA: phenylalanine--tRNA ligase beta subunit-related protein [Candidatus Saccharimonadales bacterium]|nr:phenylalanine--tRNA ligase beta subunit-related protein [Candidatus Saccharimonadales bacterium]
MKLSVNPQLFIDFDNPRIAVTVVKDTNNRADISAFTPELAALTSKLQADYGDAVLSQLPKIATWREAYRKFGVKAKDYPSSIEALYKRVTRGGSVGGINPLVDIYNYISLKHMLPAGGEDTDKMRGDLSLTYAAADENPVAVLGKDEAQAPTEGEVIYKDDEGTICRRWNWREVARTILTEDTTNCILVLEALNPVTDEELKQAQQELGELVQKYCGGSVEYFVLDKDNPSIGD